MFKSTDYEKSPLQSKKFLAYLFSNISMKIYMFYATMKAEGDFIIVSAIFCSVFLDVGYILGQSSLDRYVRMAKIAASANESLKSPEGPS